MSGTTMVFLIVLVGVIGSILRTRYTALGRVGTSHAEAAPAIEDNRRMREEIGQLKDRIAVLERVITDTHKSADLDREIERLRDR